jgi:hypothetical protein
MDTRYLPHFKGKEGLFEWLEWIKDIPMGCLFIVGWGLYWTVGMCLALLFIDLVLVHKITGGLGFWIQILLLIVVVYLLWSFYVLYCKITKRNS